MKRKLLSILLCLAMALSLLPTAALAEGEAAEGSGTPAAEYVAQIGTQGYATLQEAIDAAKSGDTIVLKKSISATEIGEKKQLQFEKEAMNLTLDLNQNTITAEAGEAIAVNAANITLTVKNGTIKNFANGKYSDGVYAYKESNNLTLTFENIVLESRTQGLAVQGLTSNSNVNIVNSKITSTEELGIYYPPKSGTLTITDSEITGVTGIVVKGSNLVVVGDKTVISGTGPNVDPDTYYTGATDGSSSLTETGDALYIESGYNDRDITVAVKGGSFTSAKAQAVRMFIKNGETTTVKREVKVTGGTFSSDVSAYVAEGYVQNENGTVEQLGETNAVAKIDDTYYKTLAEAVAAAKDGDTITLLKDAELTSTLNLAKNITIDGQGKYTIKAANSFTVGSDNKTYCVLYVSGEVTLKDVTVNGNEKCRVIFCDKGKLTIDGATITNGKAPNFIGGVYMTSSASFEMKSGSITGNKNAKGYQNDEYLQYSSDLWIGANANGALTAINGGTIGNVFVNANAWSASNPGSFTMNGGTVTNLYVEHDANYGATFKYNDGTIEHLYLSKENGNGQSIEVTPVKGVIYNGGVKEQDLVTLTMKYNDGATADSTYNVASGTTITLPTPRRSGYTFNGWYDGSKFYAAGASYTVSATVTLNASWSYISSGSSSYDPTYSVSTPSKTENGSVTVSPKNASKGDTVTVTVKPDSGYVLETLTVTDKNGNELTLKDKGNGKYTFTMPAGKVEVKATFMEDNSMLNFFYDVPNNAYFYEAVKWAVENGITTGVGNDLFAPEQPCTRAQIVTFLWRAAGSPEPKGAASGMTDVVSGSYYEKAVAWAIENGITTGTTTSTFSPDATCTRAQAVTFLARALKAKAASAAEFSDVPTDSYFADAVAWAAANGVTEGIGGGLFGSDNDCTRGQIVTFLYRAYNK